MSNEAVSRVLEEDFRVRATPLEKSSIPSSTGERLELARE